MSCASLIHCASVAPVAWRASSSAQRSATSSIDGSQAARNAGQSLRRASAASQTERNVSATAWPSWRDRNDCAWSVGSVSMLRRRLAYASQPYSGSLAKRAASTGWPRSAALIASAIELFAEDDCACAVSAATRQASAKTRVRGMELGILGLYRSTGELNFRKTKHSPSPHPAHSIPPRPAKAV